MVNQNEKFREMLKEFGTAMFCSYTGEKAHARPLGIAKIEDDGTVWFITAENSKKLEEISSYPQVLITCQKDRRNYLSLSGLATIDPDKAHIDAVWSESFKVWFPKGKDDPTITLISVKPQEGEYWDERGNLLSTTFFSYGLYQVSN
jgi:general stress protein 26